MRTERRSVHDLWPLALMRWRSAGAPPAVEVARPERFEEVAELLREARRAGRRVLAMGGASGVCGALAPEPDDLVLDLSALDRMEVDEHDLVVRAQAGVNGLRLERWLNRQGMTLGHIPASLPVASLGGLVSTRSSGQESSRYGSIEDLVLGLTVALADGTLVEARVQPRTAVAPPLHLLFVGAEGSLGIVLEAVLRVHRLPEAVLGRGWRLDTLEAGLEVMRAAMQGGLRPLVLRLYDPEDAALQGLEGWSLVAAAAGPTALAEAEAALLAGLAGRVGAEDLGERPWQSWLEHRFDLSAERLRDLLAVPGSFLDTVELAATWSRLPALYREVKAHLARAGVVLCHFAHATGQGCCAYFTMAGSAPDEAAAERAHGEAWRGAMEIALRHGATISHHHGVGRARAPWVAAEMGGWWEVWRRVRSALDPGRVLNPNGVGGDGLG
ncbi:MAG TPA: FAD-binding oxidoreductase [Candidatus Dormibacteraeota bacterium]|nr:FAD-binding oxidoreductase [Candidatus Dormibacteraeota bacterium]